MEGILVLQLLCYDNIKGAVIKNNTRGNCFPETLMNKCAYLISST